jgi:hypothetical protein
MHTYKQALQLASEQGTPALRGTADIVSKGSFSGSLKSLKPDGTYLIANLVYPSAVEDD